MIRHSDIPNMTIDQLGELAEQIRTSKPGKCQQQITDRLVVASAYLMESGALR